MKRVTNQVTIQAANQAAKLIQNKQEKLEYVNNVKMKFDGFYRLYTSSLSTIETLPKLWNEENINEFKKLITKWEENFKELEIKLDLIKEEDEKILSKFK